MFTHDIHLTIKKLVSLLWMLLVNI